MLDNEIEIGPLAGAGGDASRPRSRERDTGRVLGIILVSAVREGPAQS